MSLWVELRTPTFKHESLGCEERLYDRQGCCHFTFLQKMGRPPYLGRDQSVPVAVLRSLDRIIKDTALGADAHVAP
jgi:hypothetical protein